MNNYFINITKTLNLKALNKSQFDKDKFENHISIKNTLNISRNHFQQVSSDIIRKEIRNQNVKKSSTYGSIPASFYNNALMLICPTKQSQLTIL